MDRSDAATLALKLAGIYALIEAIKLIPTIAIPLKDAIDNRGVRWMDVSVIGVPLLIACALLAALAWVLIARGRRLADRLLGAPGQHTIDFTGEMGALQAIAFSVVGVVLLSDGVPNLVREIGLAFAERARLWVHLRLQVPDLLVLFIELSLGYWLFFMPRIAVRIWLRWSGTRRDGPGADRAPGSGAGDGSGGE